MKHLLKNTVLLLISVFLLSMTACGSDSSYNEIGSTEQFVQNTTIVETEPEVTVTQEKYHILKSNGFTEDGVAWVECYDSAGYPYVALINTEGKILYKHENGGSVESYEDVESGMGMIDDGQYNFINDKGEIIKTFDKSEFTDLMAVGGGQALFYKKEDGIDGFKHSIGVLGNDGNWVLEFQEITVEEDIIPDAYYAGCNMFGICTYKRYLGSFSESNWIILNGNTGKKTYLENTKSRLSFNNGLAYLSDITDKLYSYTGIYNSEDKSDMLILQETCAAIDVAGNYKATGFSLRQSSTAGYFTGDSYCVVNNVNGAYRWKYENCETGKGAVVSEYDVYRIIDIMDMGNNYLIEIKGKDDNMYFTVMDINGTELFEPIKYDSVYYRDKFILYSAPEDEGFVAIDNNGNEIGNFNYDYIDTFTCGLAVAEKTSENGDSTVVFINENGEEIITSLYE